MAELVLKIVVPEGIKTEEEAQTLILPGAAGEFSVYPRHISMVTPLTPGKITISSPGKKERVLATSGGICEVDPQSVTLILRSAEFAHEIDVSRAQKAKERAEKRLSAHDEEIDVKRAQSALHRALIRLDVAETLSRF